MEEEKKLVSLEDFSNERKRLFDIVRRQKNAIDLFKRNIDDKNVEKEKLVAKRKDVQIEQRVKLKDLKEVQRQLKVMQDAIDKENADNIKLNLKNNDKFAQEEKKKGIEGQFEGLSQDKMFQAIQNQSQEILFSKEQEIKNLSVRILKQELDLKLKNISEKPNDILKRLDKFAD